jgi:hypothetical protein
MNEKETTMPYDFRALSVRHLARLARLAGLGVAGIGAIACSGGPEATAASVAEATSTTTSIDGMRTSHRDAGGSGAPAPVCSNTSVPRPASDPGYRVQVYTSVDSAAGGTIFPAPSKSWTVEYKFTVPALPCSATWNYENQTFYIWGDLVFDEYGSSGLYPLSNYVFNQIVPQLMIGDTLNGAPHGYGGVGEVFDTWVIEAQYFWQNSANEYFVQAGSPVGVKPGDEITTKIAYTASTGSITASIAAPEGTSSIKIPAPFPNESPLLFSSWRTFFEQASAKSNGLTAEPQLNVESHFVDQQTLCSVLPWKIDDISLPNVRAVASSFTTDAIGTYSCPTPLDTLDF